MCLQHSCHRLLTTSHVPAHLAVSLARHVALRHLGKPKPQTTIRTRVEGLRLPGYAIHLGWNVDLESTVRRTQEAFCEFRHVSSRVRVAERHLVEGDR